jgi:hypothetical protein
MLAGVTSAMADVVGALAMAIEYFIGAEAIF